MGCFIVEWSISSGGKLAAFVVAEAESIDPIKVLQNGTNRVIKVGPFEEMT